MYVRPMQTTRARDPTALALVRTSEKIRHELSKDTYMCA